VELKHYHAAFADGNNDNDNNNNNNNNYYYYYYCCCCCCCCCPFFVLPVHFCAFGENRVILLQLVAE